MEKTDSDKIDILFKKYDTLADDQKWRDAFLHTELGFQTDPDQKPVIGKVYQAIKDNTDILKGNGNMGLRTKVVIMWWLHWPLGILVGSLISFIVQKAFK